MPDRQSHLVTKLCVVFLLSLSDWSNVTAQTLPDSLQQLYNAAAGYEEKIRFLEELSMKAVRQDMSLFLSVAREGMELAKNEKDDSVFYRFWVKVGVYHTLQDQLDSSRHIFYSILSNQPDKALEARLLSEIGATYYYEANDKKALESFISALRLYDSLGNTLGVAKLTNNVAVLYESLGDNSAAIEYLKKSIDYKLMLGDSSILGSSLHNLGINFDELGELDSALYYFQQAQRIREKYNDKSGLAKTYISLAILHEKDGDLALAEKYTRKSIELDIETNNQVALRSDQYSLAQYLYLQGKMEQAISIAKPLVGEVGDVSLRQSILKLLGNLYEATGRFKSSTQARKELLILNDSIHQAETEASLRELQVRFDTEQKESEIKQLTSENRIKDLQAEQDSQTRLILIILSIGLVAIAILFYSRFRVKSKSNVLLDSKNVELANLNKTKDRLLSIISHDLKSPLSSFHTITKSLTENWDKLEKEQLRMFVESLRDSSANVRDMMDNLLRWALAQSDQLGHKVESVNPVEILEKVEQQLSGIADLKKIEVMKRIVSSENVEADAQFLEIVLRNVLSNAIKFSKIESSVEVAIELDSDKQSIAITDQGIGMDQSEAEQLLEGEILAQDIQNSSEKGTGLGLTLCRELMSKMGAEMHVNSVKGKGTTIKLIFDKAA